MDKDLINKAITATRARAWNNRVLKQYYDGKHALKFAGEKFRNDYGKQLQNFADNLCKIPVNAPADRLQITGFANEKDADIAAAAWQIWKRSKMPSVSNDLHRDAFLFGESFFTVWLDDDFRARFFVQNNAECKIWRGADGKTTNGAKSFFNAETKRHELILYFPDRIEFYETKTKYKTGQPAKNADAYREREENPVTTNPFGIVPLFSLSRRDGSILNDVIPLNNALNKTIADALVSSEANSKRQRWSTGTSYMLDEETGKAVLPFDNDDLFVWSSKETAKFGNFDATTLKDFIELADYFRNEVSTVSGVPPYYFFMLKGQSPAADSMEKIETRFSSIIEKSQYVFGDEFTAGMQLAFALESRAASGAMIETKFTPANPQTEKQRLESAILKKDLGIAPRIYLSDYGLTENEINESLEYQRAQTDAATESFGKIFDGGGTSLA